MTDRPRSLAARAAILRPAIVASSASSTRAHMVRNPVMFVVEVGALLDDGRCGSSAEGDEPGWFTFTVAVWLWLTVAVRQLRRGDRRGPRQGAGRDAARDAQRDDRAAARRRREAGRRAGAAATSWSSRRAR